MILFAKLCTRFSVARRTYRISFNVPGRGHRREVDSVAAADHLPGLQAAAPVADWAVFHQAVGQLVYLCQVYFGS